jgi:hypothetical protein
MSESSAFQNDDSSLSSTRDPRFSGKFFDLNKLLNQKLIPDDGAKSDEMDDDESIRSSHFDVK